MINLSYIGMSGAGKSHWAQKMAAAGFRVISIDDRIEEKLGPELAAGGLSGISGVATWMGWPDQPIYRRHEQKYLDCEIEAMGEALDAIEASPNQGILLDTTGSVVYTGDEICKRIRALTTVVYLEASPAEEEILIARYLSDPKPVLWGDQFVQRPDESAREAIFRCYPMLSRTAGNFTNGMRSAPFPWGIYGRRTPTRAAFWNFSIRRPGWCDEIPKHTPPQSGGLSSRSCAARVGARRRLVHAGGHSARARRFYGAASVPFFP